MFTAHVLHSAAENCHVVIIHSPSFVLRFLIPFLHSHVAHILSTEPQRLLVAVALLLLFEVAGRGRIERVAGSPNP